MALTIFSIFCCASGSESFDFIKAGRLDFEAPDLEKFPCLKLAFEAGKQGGTLPAVMNAANEEAVFAFLDGKIKLYDIYTVVDKLMSKHKVITSPSIDEIFEVDKEIREQTRQLISAC